MAIVYVREIPHRRRSSINDGRLTHTRAWLVKTDDPADGTAAAVAAVDPSDSNVRIPRERVDTFPGTNFLCTSVDADTKDDHPCLFEVTAGYEGENATEDPTANPLDEPPQISYTFDQGTAPYFIDQSDPPKPVVNSAGDRFDEESEREWHTLIITVVRNEVAYSPIEADVYSNTTNANSIVIDGVTYPVGTLRLSPITGTRQVHTMKVGSLEQELIYWQVTYQFKARHQGWDDKKLDVGYQELVPDPDPTKLPTMRPITAASMKVTRPWPLNGQGRKQPKITDSPAELTFKPYKAKDWGPLLFAA